jgi:Cft2 family RNA processing exonuclease
MQGVPIYQASGLATKALSVYQAYIEMMNEDIRIAFDQVAHCPWRSGRWHCLKSCNMDWQ